MRIETPKYAYIFAIILGLLAFGVAALGPVLISVFIIFLFLGGLFGYFWPNESWRWGLWLTGPLVGVLGLSVLFAGNLNAFIHNDLPILFLSVSGSCIGSYLSARLKKKKKDSVIK